MEPRGNDECWDDKDNEDAPIPPAAGEGRGEVDEALGKDWELIGHDEEEGGCENDWGQAQGTNHNGTPVQKNNKTFTTFTAGGIEFAFKPSFPTKM